MFRRRYRQATGHYIRNDGALVLTLPKEKEMKVTASNLRAVEDCIRNGETPYRYEFEAVS